MSRPTYTAEALRATVAGHLPSNVERLGAGKKKRARAEPKIVTLPPSTFARQTLTLYLPLPDRRLHPNGRCHFRVKADMTKAARQLAAYTARIAVGPRALLWDAATLNLTVCLSAKRHADQDGAVAWIKAYQDGVADAQVIRNDSGIKIGVVEITSDRYCPHVKMELKRI